jgi:uncharacterized membrane protein YgcG
MTVLLEKLTLEQDRPILQCDPDVDPETRVVRGRADLLAPNVGCLAQKIPEGAFEQYLDSRKGIKPNAKQRTAILDTATSTSGVTCIQGPPGTGKTETAKNVTIAMMKQDIKVLVTAPQNAAVVNILQSFLKSNECEPVLSEYEFVHFTGAHSKITDTEKPSSQEATARTKDLDGQSIQTTADEAAATFTHKLHKMIEIWANKASFEGTEVQANAASHLEMVEDLPHVDNDERRRLVSQIEDSEWHLGSYYLRNVVKAVFCTISTSAHELLVAAFHPEELVIDNCAHESLANIATACGAYHSSIKHMTLAGDHKQQGISVEAVKDSNVGDEMPSRNLFAEIAANASKEHTFVSLHESYRSLRELVHFSKQFYGDDLRPGMYNANIEVGLQDTLKAYWSTRLRPNFCSGSRAQVCIDVAGEHSQQPGTTTRSNVAEAKAIAWTIKDMLNFVPSPTTLREIRPSDLGVVTPYTGQVLEIRHQLRELDVDLRDILIATTNQAQGKERNIIFFSTVINLGLTRVPMEDPFPIGFVADAKSLNVSLSRARVGRYMFGGLQAMVQMAIDKHPAIYKYKAFFDLLKKLADEDRVVSAAEWEHAMLHRQAPSLPAQSFARVREFKQLLAPVQDYGVTSEARGGRGGGRGCSGRGSGRGGGRGGCSGGGHGGRGRGGY